MGAKDDMSQAWPKAQRPRCSAACSAAGLSVCWAMTSAPWSKSALAASASLAGSYQDETQTTLVLNAGLTRCAASVKALMPETTSGIGKEAT